MPETAAPKASASPGDSSQGAGGGGGNNNLPWHLVPTFEPGDDINEYTRRLEFLANIWPTEHLAQLAPRACLQAKGAAFQKLVRLDPNKLKVQSLDGIKLVVSTLGGAWGQSKTEHKYERFERAIYSTIQKSDETFSSYVARHEVQYEDMLNLGATLEEMRAYILLRNSGLGPEDKKRIIVDAQGNLEYKKIVSAIQLLGSRFFGEVQTGSSKSGVRTKNYDVNYVDTVEEEAHHVDHEAPHPVEPDEDQILDVLLAEGDEDALVLQQFEEALIESLQGDSDIAACLNTYVEARRKLQDKARNRGFWNNGKGFSGFKGKGRGVKNKGGYSQNFGRRRMSLSHCSICHQKGHWKAECPNRDRQDAAHKPSSTSSAFAGVTVPTVENDDEFHDPSQPPPAQAFAFMAATQDLVHDPLLCRLPPKEYKDITKNSRLGYHHRISDGVHRINWGMFRDKITSLSRKTPTHMTDPLIRSDVDGLTLKTVEHACFVSEGSLGIVDLGASLSVIGQTQFEDLCRHLPKIVLESMKEAPCQVKFRFGNDSSVTGNRAIFFPVGAYWIKVVVVPSNTPFLIANSVFRALGAVIDTEEATIYFKKLKCTLPIQLSERRLYRLDLVQLLTCCPPRSPKSAATLSEHAACVSSAINQSDEIDNKDRKHLQEPSSISHSTVFSIKPEPCRTNTEPPGELTSKNIESHSPSRSESPFEGDSRTVCDHGSIVRQGVLRSSGRETSHSIHPRGGHGELGSHHEDDVRRAQGREDRLWKGPHGSNLSGDAARDQVSHVVCPDLQTQSQSQARQVSSLCATSREQAGEINQEYQAEECGQTYGQKPGGAHHSTGDRGDGPSRGRGLRELGSHQSDRPQQSGVVADAGSHATVGKSPTPSGRTSEPGSESYATTGVRAEASETSIVDATHQALLLQTWSLLQDPHTIIDPDNATYVGEIICYCRENNWVAKEMWEYMRTKGVNQHSNRGRQIRSELIEVYCSQDSQLTECMLKLNGDAERFGLKQGDLSTTNGRFRLYDRLLLKQPRHLWMSPRCKAWCRWNQFNMSKTPELAQRIMQDRQDDLVHLLLCDALFQFQQWRHPECQAHLEQPDGSHMVYQSELQAVVEQSFRAKCDMCVAGQLRNPITGELLRKSTQVLTTSRLMCDMLNFYRCSKDHAHGSIEGTIATSKLGRINLSQYTELYTRQFAQRLARCMLSGAQRSESNSQKPEVALTNSSTDLAEPDIKRRRLEEKQPPSVAYQRLEQEQKVSKLVSAAQAVAPRVGKTWLTEGPVIDIIHDMYPQHRIKGVELCKGADRYRVPPSQLSPEDAPLRMTFGVHRHKEGNFWSDSWESWIGKSRRQLILKCSPARLLITAFAKATTNETSTDNHRNPNREGDHEPMAKRHCGVNPKPDDSESKYGPSNKPHLTSMEDLPPDKISSDSDKHHGPAFMKLNSHQRQQLIRMHNNLGHPDSQLLGNVLKDQGWDQTAIEGIKDMHCPSCVATSRPKIARPSHLSTPREFNELITMDGVEWTSSQGTQYYFYHILDSGTNFQIAFRSTQRTSSHLISQVNKHWIQWAGPPQRLMTDSAGEFCSEEFAKFLQSVNVVATVIPTEAHWQMGKCERHGALLQSMLNKY